jgi:hypothetical protein
MKALLPGCLLMALSCVVAAQTAPPRDAGNRPLSAAEVQDIFNAHQTQPRATDPCLEATRQIDALEGKPLRRGALYDRYQLECHGYERVPRMNEDPSSLRR